MRGSSQLAHLDPADPDILEPQIACELEKSMDELKSEKAQYEKYGSHLQNEITTLFDKNEKLLSCLNTRQITLNDLGGKYELLEKALAEQIAIKERLMKVQQKLKELRRKKDPDDPKKVLIPLIQFSERECEAKERELDEIRWIMKRMIDTMNEARVSRLKISRFNLGTVTKALGIELKGAHRAWNDAYATAQVLLKLNEV